MSYNFNDYKKFCRLNNLKEGRYNSLRLFKLYIKDLKFELYLIIYNVKTNTEFKKHFNNKSIWIWSGHTLEWLNKQENEYGNKIKKVLNLCDYLVDGAFDINKRKKNCYTFQRSNSFYLFSSHK